MIPVICVCPEVGAEWPMDRFRVGYANTLHEAVKLSVLHWLFHTHLWGELGQHYIIPGHPVLDPVLNLERIQNYTNRHAEVME